MHNPDSDENVRFAQLFEQLSVGIAQVDLRGRFLLVNERQAEILDRATEELLTLTMQEVTHPDDLSQNMALFRRLVETGEPFTIEKRYIRPGGEVRWVRNHVSLARASGAPRYVTAVVVDITEQKLAERELWRTRAISTTMLSASLDAIVTIAADSKVIEWNKAAERIFGYPREAAVGRDLGELIIPPNLRDAHTRGMAHFLQTGEGAVLGRRVEVEGLTAQGKRIPLELAISTIELEDTPLFTAFLRDVSDRKEAEAALRQSAARLRATYEHAFAGIAEVSVDGLFLEANEQFSLITGYSRDELLQLSVWDVTGAEDWAEEEELFRRQMSGELPTYRREKRYRRKNGDIIWVELAASVVTNATGQAIYGVRVVRDISERRRWAETQALLVHELNHRVKNTLATVQSLAAQSRRSAADPQSAYDTFLDRLQALSRSHDVLTRESWHGADLAELVTEAVRPFGKERFSIEGPTARLPPAAALPLSLALHELATNAAKYGALSGPDGIVTIGWSLAGAHRLLELTWEEQGGPLVSPPTREGFGSRLLKRGLASELNGAVELLFSPLGVTCRITAELPG